MASGSSEIRRDNGSSGISVAAAISYGSGSSSINNQWRNQRKMIMQHRRVESGIFNIYVIGGQNSMLAIKRSAAGGAIVAAAA